MVQVYLELSVGMTPTVDSPHARMRTSNELIQTTITNCETPPHVFG